MDPIIKNLLDPSWWFNGLFFAFVLWVLPRVFRYCATKIKSLARNSQAKTLRKIKNARRNPMLVNAAIGKANAYHVAFLLIAYSYFLGLIFLSAAKGNMPFIFAIFLALPIYGFEIAWISSADYAKALVTSYGKLIRPTQKLSCKVPKNPGTH